MTWKEHIKYVENKMLKGIGVLCKAKPFLSKQCLKSIYYSLVHPYVTYANCAWASTFSSNTKLIYTIQKKAVRIISKSHWLEHTEPLFKSLKIMTI